MSRLVDLTGQTFGRLTVLGRADNHVSPSGRKHAQWHCKCECGKEIIVLGVNLKEGGTRSCGCLRAELDAMRSSPDLTGQRFSRLTVIGRADDIVEKNGTSVARWRCVCDCGKEVIARTQNLTNGSTKSCGCLKKENMLSAQKHSKHRFIDLTGNVFGRLTVLNRADDYVSPAGNKIVQWHCKCECGKDVIVAGNLLKRGTTRSCGCLAAELASKRTADLTGQHFSRLTVIGRADDYVGKNGARDICWRCVCDCGNEIIVRAKSLKSGLTRSCGCLRDEINSNRDLTDLTGQRFERLTVISRADDYVGKNGKRYVCWRCMCDCGNETIVRSTSLKSGYTKSCGCLRSETNTNRKLVDLTGQRFERLTVISRAEDIVEKNGTPHVCWRCVCDCGNETIVRAMALTNGTTKSCGCLRKEMASLRHSKNVV